jgi:hypothetical protein
MKVRVADETLALMTPNDLEQPTSDREQALL